MFDTNTHLQVFQQPNTHIGHFDGEYFYPPGVLEFRVDGCEVYSIDTPSKLIGKIVKKATLYLLEDLNGNILYELRK